MNAKQEAKLTMFRGVEQYLDTNSNIISTVAALVTAAAAFKAVVAGIIGTTQLTDASLAGITVDKVNSRQSLSQMAADIAAFIRVYATVNGNNTLKAEVNYPVSKLMRTRDEQVVPRCRIIYDRGVEHLSELKNYGVTAEKLTELQTAIDSYAAKTPTTRTAISSRKTQNDNLRALLRQGDAILTDQIDNLMKNFRVTNPDFLQTYESVREIHDPSTTTTQLKGIVRDSADNKPVKGAVLTVVELGKTVKTNSKGEYSIKPIVHGKFTIKVTATGYQDFEADEIEIKMGDIRHLDVSLVKM